MTRFALVTLAAAMAVAPMVAHASPRQTLMAVRLEVDRDRGDAGVLRQLNLAARSMCARTASPLFPGHEGRAWKCRRDAVAAALERRGASGDV